MIFTLLKAKAVLHSDMLCSLPLINLLDYLTYVRYPPTHVGGIVRTPKLSKLELQIMDVLWIRGETSIRDIQEGISARSRPSYGTIQTTISRMEEKRIVRRTRKVGNFLLFEPLISRDAAQFRLIDELLAMLGGRSEMLVMHLAKSGKLKLEHVKAAEREVRRLTKDEGSQ